MIETLVRVTTSVGMGLQGPQGPPGVGQLGDVDAPASADLAGTLRYREPGETGSQLQICMRNSTGDYVWTDIICLDIHNHLFINLNNR